MSSSPIFQDALSATDLDGVADALADCGYLVLENAVPAPELAGLQERVRLLPAHEWQPAAVGRDQGLQHNAAIRSDHIAWLSSSHPAEARYLDYMEVLRLGLNERLFLGLFDFESHFASYAPGAAYQKHVDALKGTTNRRVSSVLYLNENWHPDDGGTLRIFPHETSTPVHIEPRLGTLVLFLSEELPHEVQPPLKQRFSIAGWFRVNSSRSTRVDPAG